MHAVGENLYQIVELPHGQEGEFIQPVAISTRRPVLYQDLVVISHLSRSLSLSLFFFFFFQGSLNSKMFKQLSCLSSPDDVGQVDCMASWK